MRCSRLAVWIANTTALENVSAVQLDKKVLLHCGEVTLPTSSDISLPKPLTSLSVIPTSQCSPSRRNEMVIGNGWRVIWHPEEYVFGDFILYFKC